MPTQTLAPPNGELVAQAWAVQYAGIPENIVAGSLPLPKQGVKANEEPAWTRFLTIRALPAGYPNAELSERRSSVLTFDAWGRGRAGSARPAWGAALTLAELVRVATFRDNQPHGRPIGMLASGYLPARILAVYLTTEPTRVEKDPNAYAHVTVDVAVDWTV